MSQITPFTYIAVQQIDVQRKGAVEKERQLRGAGLGLWTCGAQLVPAGEHVERQERARTFVVRRADDRAPVVEARVEHPDLGADRGEELCCPRGVAGGGRDVVGDAPLLERLRRLTGNDGRLIEVGPRIFNSEEWEQRRLKFARREAPGD